MSIKQFYTLSIHYSIRIKIKLLLIINWKIDQSLGNIATTEYL